MVEVMGVGVGASGAGGRSGVSCCRQWRCQMGRRRGVGTGRGREGQGGHWARGGREVPPGYAPGTTGKQGEAKRDENRGTIKLAKTKVGKNRQIFLSDIPSPQTKQPIYTHIQDEKQTNEPNKTLIFKHEERKSPTYIEKKRTTNTKENGTGRYA